MADKSPDNMHSNIEGQSPDSSHSENTQTPLKNDSFDLTEGDSRSSNPSFGAIGHPPTTTIARPIPPAFRYVTDINSLSINAANEKNLKTNRPGHSYVTGLPTWRRGSGEEVGLSSSRNEATCGRQGPGTRRKDTDEHNLSIYGQLRLGQSSATNPGQVVDLPQMGGSQPRRFRPMNSKLYPHAIYQPLSEEDKSYRDAHGISYNYLGETTNPANISADITEEENCAVWITGLPANCTYKDLLSAIAVHHPGKVWSSHICPPNRIAPGHLLSHSTSAAKVIFYYPHEAQSLMRVAQEKRFVVQGRRPRVVPNRIKSRAQEDEDRTSRCLEISGDAGVVNLRVLSRLFDENFDYDTDEVLLREESADGLFRKIEWRFGSWRAQAGAACMAIRDHYPAVSVMYALDPCDQTAGVC